MNPTTHLLVACLAVFTGAMATAPDLHWAVVSLGWSVLGWLAGIGTGWLLWGRRKDTR